MIGIDHSDELKFRFDFQMEYLCQICFCTRNLLQHYSNGMQFQSDMLKQYLYFGYKVNGIGCLEKLDLVFFFRNR